MELRLLHYFITVAEELHFGRAATRLHISQPPLSQQIKQLEEELGVQLLVRTKRRVELTEPGRYFLTAARAILAQTKEAIAQVQRAARGEIGRLNVGLVSSASFEDVIPGALRLFRKRSPEVAVVLHELSSTQQLSALHDGKIDIGFLRPPIQDSEITLETIYREPLIVAMPATHRLAQKKELRLRELADEAFVLMNRQMAQGFYDQILKLCLQEGFSPAVSQEATEIHTMIGLVAAGFGVAIVPFSARNMRRSGVRYLPIKAPTSSVEVAAAYLKSAATPVLHSFLKILKEVAKEAARKNIKK